MAASALAPISSGNSGFVRHDARSVARVREHTESTQSSLSLKVTTAEGDTVELSLDASILKKLERGSAYTPQASASINSASKTDSLKFNLKVTGNLNDQEVSDIASLIQTLETGQPLNSPLSSLSSFDGSFKQTQTVSDSQITLYPSDIGLGGLLGRPERSSI
jgi:hypothetical protein